MSKDASRIPGRKKGVQDWKEERLGNKDEQDKLTDRNLTEAEAKKRDWHGNLDKKNLSRKYIKKRRIVRLTSLRELNAHR